MDKIITFLDWNKMYQDVVGGEPPVATPSTRVALCNIPYTHLEFPEPKPVPFVKLSGYHPYLGLSPNDEEEDQYETDSEDDDNDEEGDDDDEDDEEDGNDNEGSDNDARSVGSEGSENFDGDD